MISPTKLDTQFARDQLLERCHEMQDRIVAVNAPGADVPREVHAIRQLGKALRGGFAAFQLEKTAAAEIQAIGRLFSEPRDTVSRLNTWKHLVWVDAPEISSAVGCLLARQVSQSAHQPPHEAMQWCLTRADLARKCLSDVSEKQLRARCRKGIKRISANLAKQSAPLINSKKTEHHEARKAIKAWLGACQVFPDHLLLADPALEAIADSLGRENDLFTLGAWLRRHGFTRRLVPSLWKQIDLKGTKLRRKIRKRAKRLKLP